MTWQWESFLVFVCECVCVCACVLGSVCKCVSIAGPHIAQGTNFSNGLIAGTNEVRQESAELVNSWRACQIPTCTQTHTCTDAHSLTCLTSLSQCLMHPVRVESAKLNTETFRLSRLHRLSSEHHSPDLHLMERTI